nr:uncharacterized protein LOC119176280 isoform X2 [Rhipicephalus microplus]
MPEFMHCCSGPISIYRLALEAKQGRMARRKKKHGAYNENLSSLPLKEKWCIRSICRLFVRLTTSSPILLQGFALQSENRLLAGSTHVATAVHFHEAETMYFML